MLPIGIQSEYYAKWYRPDLQGIVIVGDINVDEIEAKLKKVFADVKAPVNPAERIYLSLIHIFHFSYSHCF